MKKCCEGPERQDKFCRQSEKDSSVSSEPRDSQGQARMFSASRKDERQRMKGSKDNHLPCYDQRSAKEHILPQIERGRAVCVYTGPSFLARCEIRRMIHAWNQWMDG